VPFSLLIALFGLKNGNSCSKIYLTINIVNFYIYSCYTTVGRLRGKQVLMLETGWKKSCGVGCIMSKIDFMHFILKYFDNFWFPKGKFSI
jgi:hypothetical protein